MAGRQDASAHPVVRNLQVLRFVAAAMIVLKHIAHQTIGAANVPYDLGFGVDLFFVISGFVMALTAGDTFGRPGAPWAFLRRRLVRIVPLYWLMTALMLAGMTLAAGAVTHRTYDPAHIAASFLFLPWPNPEGELRPVLSLGWTLNYEMLFYALFGLALVLPRRAGLPALAATLIGLVIAGAWVPPGWFVLKFWTDPIILEFLAGVGIGLLYRRGVRLNGWLALAIVLADAAMMPVVGPYGWTKIGLAALIIGAAACAPEPDYANPASRFLLLGGNASYALYLSHPFAIGIVGLLLPVGHDLSFTALALLAAVAGAIVLHLWVERPVIDWLRRRRVAADRPL